MINKRNIVLFGAGGHAKVVIDIIEKQGKYQILGLIDKNPTLPDTIYDYPVIETIEQLNTLGQLFYVVAIGNNQIRHKIHSELKNSNLELAEALIHPSAQVAKSATLGRGTVLMAGSIINSDSIVKENVIINTAASLDHDCIAESDTHIAPGTTICGGVLIGRGSLIGAGVTIHPNVVIGEQVTVGAGSTVLTNIPNNLTVFGTPAMRKNEMKTSVTSKSTWPQYDSEQIAAVSQVLETGKVNYWTGNNGKKFEEEYADYIGVKHAVAVANGTVALELALRGLGIGQDDEVITTSRTFIATISSIVLSGAIPVFADIDPDSQNITLETIKGVVSEKTKAIIVVHLAGWPCEMSEIMSFAQQNNIKVIEDCAQAHGAEYKGRKVGSIGDVAAFSFCQDKIMTTGGEGGIVTTNDTALWEKMWSFKDHGKSWHDVHREDHPPGFRWLHSSFGSNYRMTEMQSVLGRIQLKMLDGWLIQRQKNCERIWDNARAIESLRVPRIPEYIIHAGYKCYIFIRPEMLKPNWDKVRIAEEISKRGVTCLSGSCSEVYLEKAFDDIKVKKPERRLQVAKKLGETALMFLVHPTMAEKEISETNIAINEVMALATRV